MIAQFHLTYGTKQGEQIVLHFKRNNVEETVICQSYDALNWQGAIEIEGDETIEYKYIVQSFKGLLAEHGTYRQLTIPKGQSQVFYQDQWRAEYEAERTFFSAAFKDVIFRRKAVNTPPSVKTPKKTNAKKNTLVFQLYAAYLPENCVFALIGNTPALGNWAQPILLSSEKFTTGSKLLGLLGS